MTAVQESVDDLVGRFAAAFRVVEVRYASPHGGPSVRWSVSGDPSLGAELDRILDVRLSQCAEDGHASPDVEVVGDWIALTVCTTDCRGALIVARRANEPFTEPERSALAIASALMAWTPLEPSAEIARHQRRLDELVTEVAAELMGVTALTVERARLAVTRRLAEFFGMDTAFLRHNDHVRRVSVLVAEWPPRPFIPDPDPLGVVPFDSGDPTFDLLETLREPMIRRPEERADYQQRVKDASGQGEVTMACVPMIDGTVTVGVLGFIRFRDREWLPEEISALGAIASQLTQVEARVQAEQTLKFNAFHDDLTGLPNRRGFLEHLQQVVDSGETMALMFLDMDRLKAMNDTLGHVAGDDLICAVAERMTATIGEEGFAARLAGDEFVAVISPCRGPEHAWGIARRLLEAISKPVSVAGHVLSRTASIGLTCDERVPRTVSELLHQADAALLNAKAKGGNEVVVFNDAMRAQMEWRSDLELHVREAISQNQLQLHYQPEFDLRTGQVEAVEALVRWRHPMHGLITPDSFIDIIEQTNLASELGAWVINEACSQLARWRETIPGLRLRVGLNVSPAQLVSKDIVDVMASAIARYEIEPGTLCLEITERSVVRDLDTVLGIASDLQAMGVLLAIDDFGTGYSSYAQIRALPLDIVKIDRSFVTALGADARDEAIISSIAGLARAFAIDMIAEGVETPAAVERLLEHGCYRAQGYLMSRPVVPSAIVDIIQAGGVDMVKLGVSPDLLAAAH